MISLLRNIIKNLYIHSRFYYFGIGVIVIFLVSFFLPFVFLPAQLLLFVLLIFTLCDIIILFNTNTGIYAERILAGKLSNGDENQIKIKISNYESTPKSL